MSKTATIEPTTKLGVVLKLDREAAMAVMANFGLVHCAHCAVDENQSIEAACREHGAPVAPVVKALAAAIK